MTRHCSQLLLLLILFAGQHAMAQALPSKHLKKATYDYDFVRGEHTVFFDDFSGEPPGKFPSRWRVLGTEVEGPLPSPTKGSVRDLGGVRCLYFIHGNGDFAQPLWDTTGYSTRYKGNYWSVEFDFKLVMVKDNAVNDIGIDIKEDTFRYEIISFARWWNESNKEEFTMSAWYMENRSAAYGEQRIAYPVKFNDTGWHHYAVAIKPRETTGYIDRCKFLKLPTLGYYLPNIILNGRARVAIKNFRIARTDSAHRRAPEADVPLTTLLSENKLVTHAINFDKNKAEIKPGSILFITQLAGFLKANPQVKLEIDGHTDSDGTAAANMTLSQNRAKAIKASLVHMGIGPERLTTRGFGASHPIETNATPEGMALNRRVEFVRK